MKNLFAHKYELFPFQLFSASHLTMLIVLVPMSIFLFVFRKQLRRIEKPLKFVMLGGLLLLESLYHYWLYKDGYFYLACSALFHQFTAMPASARDRLKTTSPICLFFRDCRSDSSFIYPETICWVPVFSLFPVLHYAYAHYLGCPILCVCERL